MRTITLLLPGIVIAAALALLVPLVDCGGGPEALAQSEGVCTVTGLQEAGASVIEFGDTVGLQVTLQADCPAEARGRADILLALDRSSSMGDAGKFEAAGLAVRQFVQGVDFARHRVGLVIFNDSAFVMQPLTTDPALVVDALEAVDRTEGSTDIGKAIDVSDRELEADGREEAVSIIVLLTDGRSGEDAMMAASDRARSRGTVVFAIGLGADAAHDALRRAASTPEHYYFAPSPVDLADIYDGIAATIRLFTVTDVELVDRLAAGVTFVSGSGHPDQPDPGPPLKWRRGFLPSDPITFSYQVRIDREGRIAPSASLRAAYTDGDGARRQAVIPSASIDVIVPDTHYAYLPVSYRNQCIPATSWADIVLVIDVSSSMSDENKLGQAVAAAQTFVDLTHLPSDQAAVVAYDALAQVEQPLTGNRAAVKAALARLTAGRGTRLDRGLQAATLELMSSRHRRDNRPVIIFLSDGRQVEERHLVYEAAQFARSLGIAVFTIALGEDADRDLLRDIAGSSSRTYYAPSAADLSKIYSSVAGIVRCR